MTSDQYLEQKANTRDIIRIRQRHFTYSKHSILDFIFGQINQLKASVLNLIMEPPQILAKL